MSRNASTDLDIVAEEDEEARVPLAIALPTYQEATMDVPVTTPGGVRTVTIFLDLTENKSRDFGLTLKTTAGLHYEFNVFYYYMLLLHHRITISACTRR